MGSYSMNEIDFFKEEITFKSVSNIISRAFNMNIMEISDLHHKNPR